MYWYFYSALCTHLHIHFAIVFIYCVWCMKFTITSTAINGKALQPFSTHQVATTISTLHLFFWISNDRNLVRCCSLLLFFYISSSLFCFLKTCNRLLCGLLENSTTRWFISFSSTLFFILILTVILSQVLCLCSQTTLVVVSCVFELVMLWEYAIFWSAKTRVSNLETNAINFIFSYSFYLVFVLSVYLCCFVHK